MFCLYLIDLLNPSIPVQKVVPLPDVEAKLHVCVLTSFIRINKAVTKFNEALTNTNTTSQFDKNFTNFINFRDHSKLLHNQEDNEISICVYI